MQGMKGSGFTERRSRRGPRAAGAWGKEFRAGGEVGDRRPERPRGLQGFVRRPCEEA